MGESSSDESVVAVLISFGIALFGSLLAHSTVCAEQHECLKHETCYAVSDMGCSFRTSVTPAGWRMLNQSSRESTLQSLNRGICAPGMRQGVTEYGLVHCIRQLSYPDATNTEIQDATGSFDHERFCGSWINAGSISRGIKMWAFFDEKETENAIDELVKVKGSSRLAISDVAKFRSSCRIMVTSNSAGAAASLAFNHLLPHIKAQTLEESLESIGFLASHYCDGPALVGVGMESNQFVFQVLGGVVHEEGALQAAMYAVGESRSTRDAAGKFAALMASYDTKELGDMTESYALSIVRGTHMNTYVDTYLGPGFKTGHATYNAPLQRFVKAYGSEHGGRGGGAQAYLRGTASVCALAARSVVVSEPGAPAPSRRAAALGRLHSNPEAHRFDPESIERLSNASVLTLSSLSVSSAARQSAWEVCLAASKRIFPDAFDKITFDALVSAQLYERLRVMTDLLKEAAAVTLSEDLIGRVYSSHDARTEAVAILRATPLRIAGAPRGSWAGIQREFRRPDLTSDDGTLVMMLKQARALFLDRLVPVATEANICEHPPLFSGVSRNAYLLLSTYSACAVVLPGLIVPPFAGERFSDQSLYERLGFVITHEFLHVTAAMQQWDATYASRLLIDYPVSTHREAIADVGAVAALVRFRVITNESICQSVSQLFCGRVGFLDNGGYGNGHSHPTVNARGNSACNFARKYFGK